MSVTKSKKRPLAETKAKVSRVIARMKNLTNRANAAHVMMIFFVSFNTIGAWIIAPQYGFITAGVCSGIYGYLLGNE